MSMLALVSDLEAPLRLRRAMAPRLVAILGSIHGCDKPSREVTFMISERQDEGV